jgi:Flp pilus assembly protein TadG
MKLKLLWHDTRGAVIVEFSVTIAFFLSLTFGLVQAGLLLWTYSGLQHGVEVAARCASVNYSANQLGLGKSCFTVDGAAVAPSTVIADTTNTYIEKYAQQNSFGLVPAYTSFTVTMSNSSAKCGTNFGYLVRATYTFDVLHYIFSVPLTAASCFPINVS